MRTQKSTKAPADLLELCRLSDEIHHLFPKYYGDLVVSPRNGVKKRKLQQLEQVVNICGKVLGIDKKMEIKRVMDVGSGQGHLSFRLADVLSSSVDNIVGLERCEELLRRASVSPAFHSAVSFICCDAVSSSISTRKGDLVVGLHACGSLGDTIVNSAAELGSSAVILVTCCLQKRHLSDSGGVHFRLPISTSALSNPQIRRVLTVAKHLLGATNRCRGYNSEAELRGRITRYGLRKILKMKGFENEFAERTGSEVHGISKHKVKKGLTTVVGDALRRRGNFDDIFVDEIKSVEVDAEREYRVMRALTLPRAMIGDILEMAIVLDRAARLEESEQYHDVLRIRVFPDEISPRNLCLIALPLKS